MVTKNCFRIKDIDPIMRKLLSVLPLTVGRLPTNFITISGVVLFSKKCREHCRKESHLLHLVSFGLFKDYLLKLYCIYLSAGLIS